MQGQTRLRATIAILTLAFLLDARGAAETGVVSLTAAAPSTRIALPFTVSFAASGLIPSVGLDLSYQLGDRLALGVQATTIVAHSDVSLRARYFVLARPDWGVYAGVNGRMWHSPLLFSGLVPAGDAEVGFERRRASGFTWGVGGGLGVLRAPCCNDQPGPVRDVWSLLGHLNLRLGKSF